MSRNPKKTQDNINNIRDDERTIPEIDRNQKFAELESFLDKMKNPSSESLSSGQGQDTDNEVWNLKKNTIMEVIKKNQEKYQNGINSENLKTPFDIWMQWRKENVYWDMKCNDLWETAKKKEGVEDVVNKLNLFNYNKYYHANITGISVFKQPNTELLVKNKPLGSAGDITVNELISKGLELVDTPLVHIIRDNVDASVVGGFISSMIMYKTIVNLYIKSAYGQNLPEPAFLRNVPTTRAKEIALFMLVGAPFVAGWLWTGKQVIGGKVVVNILANEIEGSGSVKKNEIEGISKSSLFLLLNKLPSWLKAILKYTALYFIGLFIIKVFGYQSNIINEIYFQVAVYLIWFLKIYLILNLLVLIYFVWKLYIIVMFAKNKEYLNPEGYPKFIKNELLESKDISNYYIKDPGIIYKHYLKLICIYSSIVFFGVIVIILYASS